MDIYLETFFKEIIENWAVYLEMILFPAAIIFLLFRLGLLFYMYHKRVRYLEITLAAVLKHAGIEFNDANLVPFEVRKAIDEGHRLKAIRLYRKITGAELKEATEVVDVLLKDTSKWSFSLK